MTTTIFGASYQPVRFILCVITLLGLEGLLGEVKAQDISWETVQIRQINGQENTGYYRNLETLDDMHLPSLSLPKSDEKAQFQRAIQQSLIRLYRTNPELVDSLFEAHVIPGIDSFTRTEDFTKDVDTVKREAYQKLRRHIREPLTRLKLGTDVRVNYPSSLRQRGIGGEVVMQVYINEEGEPLGVKLIKSAHPDLIENALTAATQMRWTPAYIAESGKWIPATSWARFRINFRP